MGMNAELFAVGPHRKELVPCYEYPAGYYEDVPELTPLITLTTSCASTDGSRALAEALDIYPWAFEQHRLLSPQVAAREAELRAFADEWHVGEDVEHILALARRGWVFYYRPNG